MKPIIAAVITCAVLFGVSFGASNYFADKAAETETEEGGEPIADSVDQESTLPPDQKEVPKKVAAMPVAHRPEKSISLEAVLQMSDSIKKMEEKLLLREKKLAKEEQRVQLLFNDVATEQDELQAFSEGVDAKVAAMERMAEALRETLATLDARKAELVALEKKTGVDDESQKEKMDDKINGVKGWFANLEAEQAADYLKEFANTGKLEFAASLLHKMQDRQKSKILAALNDPVLVSQLIESLEIKPKEK